MAGKKVRKVNHLTTGNNETWIENRDFLVDQMFPRPPYSDITRLPKSGINLEEEFEKAGYKLEPGQFVKGPEIDY